MTGPIMTERQEKWMASVRASFERETGKTFDQWVAIARACPEEKHRARLKWMKETHGLLQNRASLVLGEAFGGRMTWSEPEKALETLWADPASRAIFDAVGAAAQAPGEVIQTARRSFCAWSRKVQFAAARPVKGGMLMLGLAVPPDASPRLEAPKNESWSERLKARMLLASPAEVDDEVRALLRVAWEKA
jgi:hypothetical protein